jgi:hypothetical protein
MKLENGKLYKWLAKDRKYEDGTDKYYYHFAIGKYYDGKGRVTGYSNLDSTSNIKRIDCLFPDDIFMLIWYEYYLFPRCICKIISQHGFVGYISIFDDFIDDFEECLPQ